MLVSVASKEEEEERESQTQIMTSWPLGFHSLRDTGGHMGQDGREGAPQRF